MTVSQSPFSLETERSPQIVKRRPSIMLIVRRVHLYSGLFLVPWVLLYGVTAFLFNHPTVATERTRDHFAPEELGDIALAQAVDAAALAQYASVALGETLGGELSVVPGSAEVTRGGRASWDADDGFHSLSADATGGATYSYRPAGDDTGTHRAHVDLPTEPAVASWAGEAESFFAARGGHVADDGEAVELRGPVVTFDAETENGVVRARYDVGRRNLTAVPVEQAGALETRSFLLRLHLSHVYPGAAGARWIWALIVDLMAFSMVTWGLSGLAMWWQMKRIRRIGSWVLVASVGVASVIGAVMYTLLAA